MQIEEYQKNFPELVQKIYTKKADRQVLETVGRKIDPDHGEAGTDKGYNYEKFFCSCPDSRHGSLEEKGFLWNTSFKSFAASLITGKQK